MMSTTFLITILSASIALALPLNYQVIQPEAVYAMKSFTTHNHDDDTINTVFFDITSANGGTLDFTCSAFDPALGHVTESFQSGKVYSCGKDSSFSFSYTPNGNEKEDDLILWQNVNGTETWKGSTTPAAAICRTGNSGASDLICVSPDQEDSYIEMRKS
jgi:hypothetical protein